MKPLPILAGLCLLVSTTYAQETTAGGALAQEASWQALQSRINATNGNVSTLRIDVDAIRKCGDQGKVWASKGCIAPSGSIKALQVKGSRIKGLTPKQTYMISVYGYATGTGHIVVRECASGTVLGSILAESAKIGITDRTITDSTLLAITAPTSGCIQGYTHSTREAYSVTAFTVQ